MLDPRALDLAISTEYMDTKRHLSADLLRQLKDLFRLKYAGQEFAVIITTDDNALRFMLDCHDEIFPGTPVVFCGVNFFRPRMVKGRDWLTGVLERPDFVETLESIQMLMPGVKRVAFITDNSVSGRGNRRILESLAPRFGTKLKFEFLDHGDGLDLPLLEERLQKLGPETAVQLVDFFQDRHGNFLPIQETVPQIVAMSPRPIFVHGDMYLGLGVVGGKVVSSFHQGEAAGLIALRILSGEPLEQIPVVSASPNRYIFDYRAMARFGLDPGRLPPGSILLNRPESFWSRHAEVLLGALAFFLVQGLIILALAVNVVKRRRAEKAAKASEEQYRVLVENAQDPIYIIQDGTFGFVNNRVSELSGYLSEEILGRPFLDLVHPDDREWVQDRYQRRIEGQVAPTGYPMRVLTKVGKVLWLQVSAVRIEWQGRPATLNIARDITRQVKVEEQLRQSQKMEALGTLAGGIAHDFNNILGVIMGFAELGLMQAKGGRPAPREMEQVITAAERARNLVLQILTFSRRLEPQLAPLDVNQVIRDAAKLLERTIPKMVSLVLDLSPGPEVVSGDATQIEQVLINLAANARDAMPEGGRLDIITRQRRLDAEFTAAHPEMAPGVYVQLTVSDTGEGIPPEALPHIFEPFYTTKGPGKGTGLGLSTAYGIIKGHGGHLICQSQPGQGTRFDIFLPRLEDRPIGQAEQAPRETTWSGHGEKVLLVDDEAELLEVGGRLMERAGLRPITAASGEEALERFARNPDGIALVILDLGMPGMGGLRCLEELLALKPAAKVIIASGYTQDQQVQACLQAGAAGFVGKPYQHADLLEAVRKALYGQDE